MGIFGVQVGIGWYVAKLLIWKHWSEGFSFFFYETIKICQNQLRVEIDFCKGYIDYISFYSLFLKRNYSDTETEGEIFNSLVQYFGDNLGRKVKAMPLVEETSLLEDSSVTFPVVIIGKLLYFIF